MVPKGWECQPLATLLEKVIDYRGQSVPKASHGIPLITARNVRDGYLDFTSKEFISDQDFDSWMKRGKPRAGDILFTTEAPLGKACRYPEIGRFAVGQRTVTLRTNSRLDSNYLLYFILSKHGQHLIDLRSSGSTAKGIKSSELKKIKILYPIHVAEQKKIAQILSTWDKAITTTEQLLANSQQQKKALMQQLLTGKKRLLDENGERFCGEWESKQLSKLGEVIGGLTYSPSDVTDGSGTLVLRSSNVQNGRLSFDDNVYVTCTAPEKSVTRENDILLCVRNGSRALIGKSALLKDQAVGCFHGAFMSIFRAKEPLFIFQLLQSSLFYREVRKNLGATINSINGSDLKKFTFNVPTDKAEREKIAAIFSTADQEISALQQKLDHLKKEKKALMQQLLTGKRRVLVN
jgi:type I restriction enzyme S subunit